MRDVIHGNTTKAKGKRQENMEKKKHMKKRKEKKQEMLKKDWREDHG
jgi:hypothetical protein